MKQADIDWRYLGRDLLVPLATAGVALIVMLLSGWFASAYEDSYARISVDQDLMNADYDALVVRKRLVDRYHRRYERFREQGFIGEESRLDWIEVLRESAEDLRLPSLNYSIEPRLTVVPPVPSTSADSNVQIYVSSLELEVGLIHELDFLRLFDELQTAARGLIKVDRCNLQRRSEREALLPTDPNIVANCSLDVFSIVTADVAEEASAI